MLGLGRGSTEATAKVRLDAFCDKIGSFQSRFARAMGNQIFDVMTGNPGAVWMQFNDVSPEDENQKADYLAKIASIYPTDPWLVMTPTYVQEYLGIEIAADDPDNPLNKEPEPEPAPIIVAPVKPELQPEEIPPEENKTLEGTSEGACAGHLTKGHRPCGSSDIRTRVRNIIANRGKIGKPGTSIRKMGESGEKVVGSVMTQYHAHETWSAPEDMTNDANIEIKLLNQNTEQTPIMPEAHGAKVSLSESNKKPWKFIILKPTDKSIELYGMDEPADFRDAPDDVYILKIKDAKKMGQFDTNGQYHKVSA